MEMRFFLMQSLAFFVMPTRFSRGWSSVQYLNVLLKPRPDAWAGREAYIRTIGLMVTPVSESWTASLIWSKL